MQFPTTLGTSTGPDSDWGKGQKDPGSTGTLRNQDENSLSDSPHPSHVLGNNQQPHPHQNPLRFTRFSDNCRRGPGMFSWGCETPRTKPFQMGFICVICGPGKEKGSSTGGRSLQIGWPTRMCTVNIVVDELGGQKLSVSLRKKCFSS